MQWIIPCIHQTLHKVLHKVHYEYSSIVAAGYGGKHRSTKLLKATIHPAQLTTGLQAEKKSMPNKHKEGRASKIYNNY